MNHLRFPRVLSSIVVVVSVLWSPTAIEVSSVIEDSCRRPEQVRGDQKSDWSIDLNSHRLVRTKSHEKSEVLNISASVCWSNSSEWRTAMRRSFAISTSMMLLVFLPCRRGWFTRRDGSVNRHDRSVSSYPLFVLCFLDLWSSFFLSDFLFRCATGDLDRLGELLFPDGTSTHGRCSTCWIVIRVTFLMFAIFLRWWCGRAWRGRSRRWPCSFRMFSRLVRFRRGLLLDWTGFSRRWFRRRWVAFLAGFFIRGVVIVSVSFHSVWNVVGLFYRWLRLPLRKTSVRRTGRGWKWNMSIRCPGFLRFRNRWRRWWWYLRRFSLWPLFDGFGWNSSLTLMIVSRPVIRHVIVHVTSMTTVGFRIGFDLCSVGFFFTLANFSQSIVFLLESNDRSHVWSELDFYLSFEEFLLLQFHEFSRHAIGRGLGTG